MEFRKEEMEVGRVTAEIGEEKRQNWVVFSISMFLYPLVECWMMTIMEMGVFFLNIRW